MHEEGDEMREVTFSKFWEKQLPALNGGELELALHPRLLPQFPEGPL